MSTTRDMEFRVGLVGAGYIAPYHLEALAAVPGVRVVGITDVDPVRAGTLAARMGVRAFPSLRALRAAGAKVVHVLTPPRAHAEVARDAVELGCDVLVEKPLATSVAECEWLAAAAAANGCRVGVCHSLLHDAQVRRVLDAVRRGRVGAAVSAEYFCSAAYPPWPGGVLPPQYRDGGHPFRDLGVHALYLLRECLGEIGEVHGEFRSRGRDPNLCFDEWYALVHCERGTGHLRLTWNVEPLQTRFVVHAERGSLCADVALMYAATRRASPLPGAVGRAINSLEEGLPPLVALPRHALRWATGRLRPYQGLRAFIAAFYEALRSGAPLPASVEDGASVVRWVEEVARPADDAKASRVRRYAPTARPAVVVTGASGLLGKPLVRRLVADGALVRVVVRREPSGEPFTHPRVEVVLADLGDRSAVAAALEHATAVYHLGAAMQGDWTEHLRGTIAGTRHVVDGCLVHGVPRLVHVSSLSVLDWAGLDGGPPVTEEAPLEPRPEERGRYTRAKYEAERLVLEAVRERGLPAVVLRPGQLVGSDGLQPSALNAVVVGRRLLLLGSGRNVLPLVPVDDVVDALVRAGRSQVAPGTVVHLVDGRALTARALASELAAARGLHLVAVPMPVALALGFAGELLGRLTGREAPLSRYRLRSAQACLWFRCGAARILLGWQPGMPASDAAARDGGCEETECAPAPDRAPESLDRAGVPEEGAA